MSKPTFDEQIAAVRRLCEGDTQPHTIREARAALAPLEQHWRALAVVEAARAVAEADDNDKAHVAMDALDEALAAFDAGEKPR